MLAELRELVLAQTVTAPWPTEDNPIFSVGFGDVVFAIVPAACFGILALAIAAFGTREPHSDRRLSATLALASIVILDVASLILYTCLPADSPFRTSYSLVAYALRAAAFSAALLLYWRLPVQSSRLIGVSLLLFSAFGCPRLHTLWSLAVHTRHGSAERHLATIQSSIVSISNLFIIYEAAVSRRPASKRGLVEVNEQDSSTLSKLFFGWVWPLLSLGKKTKLVEADLEHIDYHPYAVHREELAVAPSRQAREFYSKALFQYFAALALAMLSAVAKLVQPFIIGAIVSFMQSGGSRATGIWLVVAMFVDQSSIAVCDAHSMQQLMQVNRRMRSFLTHKVFQRALSPVASVGSSESLSSKAMVHASVDIPSVVNGPHVILECISNAFVVVVASYMLYKQIGIAFTGPLILAIIGTFVPMLLGPKVAQAETTALEAKEMRLQAMKQVTSDVRNVRMGGLQGLTEEQVAEFRVLEVARYTNVRRVLAVVVVVAVALESLCVLAAFTIFAINPSSTLDYARLFTSLSTMTIMINPLLGTLQQIPSMIAAFISLKRVNKFLASEPGQDIQADLVQRGVPAPSYQDDGDVQHMLKLDSASVGWTDDSTVLHDVSATVDPGDIVVVTGRSASGKSTLLKSVLGEGQIQKGFIELRTRDLAFCDQVPWFIPGLSLRDNIILSKAFNQILYDNILKCCCLIVDFARLENGDQTVINSKGSSLSGGQRVRLSLARALYQEAALLLLDDVFTGLDRTTLSTVADNLFGPDGYLSKRPHISVLLASIIVPPVVTRHAKARLFLISEGKLTLSDIAQTATTSSPTSASVDNIDVEQTDEETGGASQSSSKGPAEENDIHHEVSGEYTTYIRSLGSLLILYSALVFIFAYAALCQAATFWLTRWSGAYAAGSPVNSVFYVGIYAVFTAASLIILTGLVCLFFLKMIPESGLSIHKNMLATFIRSPASVIEATKSQILNRFTQDVNTIDNDLPFSLINFQLSTALIISNIVVVGIGAPVSLVLLILAVPPLWVLQGYYLATSTRLRVLQMGSQAPILGALEATLDGRLTLRAFNLNDRMMFDMTDRVYKAFRPGYLFSSLQNWLSMTLDIGNIALITLVSAVLIVGGQQTGVSWGSLALLNTLTLAGNIKNIMHSWTAWEMSLGAMTRILSYTTKTPAEYAKGSQTEVSDSWPNHGKISLEGLTLAYTNKEIVRDLSLQIPAGTKIAILGRTGSGKTSLMQSFFGLLRTVRGSLKVDSVELNTVMPSVLRSRLVGNPQQTFSNGMASLRRNMDPSQTCSDDEIRAAIERVTPDAAFRDLIMSKLDSRWEECRFSVGNQRQIGLARMMLRKSSVYILDEPTSGMDDADHDGIMNCLFQSLAEKTVLVITHSVKGIEKFDYVVVMADGKLVESAPPSELLQDTSSQLYKYVHASSSS